MEGKDNGMRVIKVFFLGLVFGWLIKWVIDEALGNHNLRTLTNENILLRERIKTLETPKSHETLSVKRTTAVQQPIPEPKPVRSALRKDDLKLIKGVGPVIEEKLNDAGINTFNQLSRITTMDIQKILGTSKRAAQNADNLLTQARKFAQQKSKR